MTAKLWAGLLAAVRSIDKRGKGKTVLVADYNPIHAALGDASLLAQFAALSGLAPAPPGTPETPETYAPTIPIALPPIEAVGEVTHQWLASCDKHDGTNVASGVTSYTPTPTVGGGSEILGTPTDTSIGSYSTVPTYTRVGVDWNMTSGDGGASGGLEDTTDKIAFRGWAYTSHKALSAVVGSFSSSDYPTYPSDYSGAGIMLRDSSAAGSKFLCVYYAQNKYVYAKWRGTTDGSVSQAYAVSDGSFGLLYIDVNGDGTFSCYRQTSGQPRQLIKTTTTSEVTLSATGIGGTFCFSLTAQVASASFTQIALRSATRITKTTTTVDPVALTLYATDVAGNSSAASASVTATPTTESSIKWNPGIYVGDGTVLTDLSGSSLTDKIAEIEGNIDRHMGNSTVTGFHFRVAWAHLEPTKNNYNFTTLDGLIDYIHTNYPGKLWSLEIWFVKFSSNATNYVPTYLSSESDAAGGWYTNTEGYATKANIYKASIMDRGIALYEAFAAYYAADDTLACIHTGESSFGFSGASGWSVANETTQMHRFYDALAACSATINAPIFANINYYNSATDTESLVNYAANAGLGLGGPDTLGKSYHDSTDQDYIWGQAFARGRTYSGGFTNGGTDWRGVVPIGYQNEEPEMIGWGHPGAPYYVDDCYDMQHNVLYNNYWMIQLTSTAGYINVPAYTVSNTWFAYIEANGLVTRTTLPSIYA